MRYGLRLSRADERWTRRSLRALLFGTMIVSVATTGALAMGVSGAAAAATPLYPDLQALPPRDLRFATVNVSPDPAVTTTRRVLQFSQTTWNAGPGPLDLRTTIDPNLTPPSGPTVQRVYDSAGGFTDYDVGSSYYHAVHQHYHYDGWGLNQLWKKADYDTWVASGRTSTAVTPMIGVKTTSCVTDEEFIAKLSGTPWPAPYGAGGCQLDASNTLHEGLSVGWGDTYDWYRFEQWIDLGSSTATLPDDQYVLRTAADPNNQIYESADRADPTRESPVGSNDGITNFTVSGGQILDQSAATGSIALNAIADSTVDPTVTVSAMGRDDVSGVTSFRLSNDNVTFSPEIPSTTTSSVMTTARWSLTDPAYGGTTAGGPKTVYAQFLDKAGRRGPSTSATISYLPAASGGYASTVLADVPAGYWRLGEASGTSAKDETGAHPGTYNGGVTLGRTGLLPAQADTAAGLDGTSGHVRIPDGPGLSPSAFSVEAWIRPDVLPAAGAFASVATKNGAYSLQFNGPLMEFTLINGTGRQRLQAPSGAVVAGHTYHVVGIWDGTTQRLYLDGTQVAQATPTTTPGTSTNPLTLGSWDGSSEFLTGTVDDVAVYPAALTAARVAAHHIAGTANAPSASPSASASPSPSPSTSPSPSPSTSPSPTAASSYRPAVLSDKPTGYWQLGERSGTAAADAAGAHPGAYQGSPTLGRTSLIPNQTDPALGLNGTSTRVRIPDATGLDPSTFSLEAWIRPDRLPATGAAASIATKAGAYSLQLNGPLLEFTLINGSTVYGLQAPAGAIAAGQSYHVVGTWSGSTQRLYVNGALCVSASRGKGPATNSTKALYLGSWDGSSKFFPGTIDDVALYPNALSATRITAHRDTGMSLPVSTPTPTPSSSPSPSLSASPTPSASASPSPSTSSSTSPSPTPSASVLASPSAPSDSTAYRSAVLANGPAGYWQLGEAAGTTAADVTGAYAGTFQGAPALGRTSLIPTQSDTALGLDGTGSRVQILNGTGLNPSSFSLEAWIRPDTLPAAGAFASIATKDGAYSLQFNGPLLEFTLINGGTKQRLQAAAGAITAGRTAHLVATWDGTTQKLYINGALSVQATRTSGPATTSTSPLYLGSWDGNSEYFAGTIDDIALYASALTAGQVAAHRDAGTGTTSAASTPATYPVTVTLSGAGSGTVTSAPSGISCPGTCTKQFAPNTAVTLTASPAAGSLFAGWSGGCDSTETTCTVSTYATTDVIASFIPAGSSVTLTVTKGGTGSGTITSGPGGIDCGTVCTATLAAGTSVQLTAVPATGSTFLGWAGLCAGTATTCTFTLVRDTSLSGTFGP